MSLAGHLPIQIKGRKLNLLLRQVGNRLVLNFPYNRALIDEVKCMVGRRWDKDNKEWSIDYCDRNLLQLRVLGGSPPEEFSRYLTSPPAVTPNREVLRSHQLKGLSHAWHRRRTGLAAWMGTGKTLVAFELMEAVGKRFPGTTPFYVSFDKVLSAIRLEARKWKLQLTPRYITYDSLRGVLEKWVPGVPAPRCVIFDECTALKNWSAKRTEAAAALVEAMRKEYGDDCWILLMSGTPAPQDYTDWWSPTEIIYPGWLRESSVFHLRQRLAIIEQAQGLHGSFPKLVGWRTEECSLLSRRLAGAWLVINLDDTDLDLPEPERISIQLAPGEDLLRAAWLVAQTSSGGADALNKLRQLSDGFQYQEDGTSKEAGSPKDQALVDLLGEHSIQGRFIIYAAYNASVDRCSRLAVQAGWQVLKCDGRGWEVLNTKKSKDQLLLSLQDVGSEDDQVCYVGHPQAGGRGLNMQGVGAMCFYSNDFNTETRVQAEARPRRPGNRGLKIYDLVHLGTDQLVIDRLNHKLSAHLVSLDEIKGALKCC